MAHLHSIYDTDKHFIIDPITRGITSESGKVALMQYDHNSERFTFEIPKTIEGHDMSLSDKVEIHYINTSGSSKSIANRSVYEVDDLQISPDSDDMVICSWLISKNATEYAGSLAFILRFVCYDENEIAYQWFTDQFSGIKILAGIYNSSVMDDTYDLDIIEKWKRDIIQAFYESDAYTDAEAAARAAANAASAAKESEQTVAETVESLINNSTFSLRGDYDSMATYNILDVVSHDNKLWICKKAGISNIEPTKSDTTHWQLALELIPITNEEIDEIDPLVPTEVISSAITADELEDILV